MDGKIERARGGAGSSGPWTLAASTLPSHGESGNLVARLGPPQGTVFPVEFAAGLRDLDCVRDVRRELDYYLVELKEPDPWAYPLYHCRTAANLHSRVHWAHVDPTVAAAKEGPGPVPPGPLVDRVWEIYSHSGAAAETATVQPSMPILYFGDRRVHLASPLRIVTVGLNPSLEEFPVGDPWSRFPATAAFEGATSLRPEQHETYLAALNGYFTTRPYRAWFDRSFEPLLRGAGASYPRLGGERAAAVASRPCRSRPSGLTPFERASGRFPAPAEWVRPLCR